MAKADNRLHFRCACGEKVEANWKSKFPFGKKQWIAEKCRVCREVTDLSGIEVIPCPHCQSVVIKGEKYCMECNQPLDITIETLPITCPNKECEVTIYLPRNYKGDYVCRFCGKKIKEEEIRRQLKEHGADPRPSLLIELPSLPEMKGRIIHKEAGTQFPYGSRIQVSEGTYGLLMQNGVCQYPLTPGPHLLSETKLSRTSLLDAAMQGEDVVFNTEIFCVVKNLPELEHQLRSTPVCASPRGDAPAREYEVTARCRFLCQVDDAKAFVSRAGFQAVSEAEFKSEGSRMHTRINSLLSAAFDQIAHTAFETYDTSGNMYTYKAELIRLLKAEFSTLLAEDGLCLDDISLLDAALIETEDSKAKQKEYEDKCGRIETVKLPDVQQMREKQLVIYQHDKDEFEYKSRVQVNEGTYGLLLQNGACQPALMPGSYLLADCALEGTKRYDAALSGDHVVFHSSLFCVTRMLPAFEWYHFSTFTDLTRDGDAPAKEYTVRAESTVRIQVDDAKSFAAQVGFSPLSVAELCHAYRPHGQLPALNAELEKDYPAENKDGWLYVRVKAIINTIFDSVCQMVFGDRLDPRRVSTYRLDFIRKLQNEFNAQLNGTGLSVVTLDFSRFTVEETKESQKRTQDYQEHLNLKMLSAMQQTQLLEALVKAAKTQFSWEARDIELHLKDALHLKAHASFRGDCRLQIVDDEQFFDIPEVQTQAENGTPENLLPFLQNKVQAMIGDSLARFTQEFIDHGKIADLLDRYAYRIVSDYVQDELNRNLSRDGLKVHDLNISLPDSIVPGKALKDHLAVSEKKEKLKAYAEGKLLLETDPILVHMKGEPSVNVHAVFSGTAYLRVADEEMFFGTSEIKTFLASEPFVSESAVNAYYTDRTRTLFADLISRIVQAIVDQTNADIRELHRLSGLLQSNVISALNERVASFGMRLESLDMRMPKEQERSKNMLTWIEKHETQSGLALQQEIEKLENDHAIFSYNENNRVNAAKEQSDSEYYAKQDEIEISNMESHDRVYEKQAELDIRQAERAKRIADHKFQQDMDRIRQEHSLKQLADELTSVSTEHQFNELRKEYERKYTIQEMAINQAIREAQLRQQADLDAEARKARAKIDLELSAAENKRILNDILHKIDESDLDWRQKLDEYNRLQSKIQADDQNNQDLSTARTQAEIDQVLAAAKQTILREENQTFLLASGSKIQLRADEAELLEKISRYDEERTKRRLDSDADRTERKAILDFEQRMRDRQEQVAQDMEKLAQQYEHDLALREKDDKIAQMDYEQKKLTFILGHLNHELNTRADVDKARIHADEEIKKAEAQFHAQHEQDQLQAEEKRRQEQLQFSEKVAEDLKAYQTMMANLQLQLEALHHGTERNKDNNLADVAIAQAMSADQAVKKSLDELNSRLDNRYRELKSSMDRITNAHKALKDRVNEMVKAKKDSSRQTAQQLNQQPVQQIPVQQPVNPNGFYGQNLGNIAVTGGLQPGVSTKICPSCGKYCSIFAAVCEHCGHTV